MITLKGVDKNNKPIEVSIKSKDQYEYLVSSIIIMLKNGVENITYKKEHCRYE